VPGMNRLIDGTLLRALSRIEAWTRTSDPPSRSRSTLRGPGQKASIGLAGVRGPVSRWNAKVAIGAADRRGKLAVLIAGE